MIFVIFVSSKLLITKDYVAISRLDYWGVNWGVNLGGLLSLEGCTLTLLSRPCELSNYLLLLPQVVVGMETRAVSLFSFARSLYLSLFFGSLSFSSRESFFSVVFCTLQLVLVLGYLSVGFFYIFRFFLKRKTHNKLSSLAKNFVEREQIYLRTYLARNFLDTCVDISVLLRLEFVARRRTPSPRRSRTSDPGSPTGSCHVQSCRPTNLVHLEDGHPMSPPLLDIRVGCPSG